MNNKAESIISQLGLKPHIEGGYFIETYKNPFSITKNEIDADFEGKRPLVTTIYFLLKSGQISKFHKLKFDEQWFFHSGSALLIYLIDKNGNLNTITLGKNIEENEKPQFLLKSGVVLGAEVVEDNSYCLVSCVVSPGFDYRDFVLFEAEDLIKQFPQHEDIIRKFNS